jgi:ankyrin repeat protein
VRADDSFSLRDLLARDDSDLVNETDAQGRTALHIAVSDPLRDHPSVIKALLRMGADVSLETADRKTALRLAIENGNGPAVRLFLSSVPMSVKDIKPLIDEFKDDPNLQIRAAVGNLERWGQNVALIAHAVETKNTDELKRLLRTTRVRLDSTTAMDQPLLGQMSSSGWLEGLQALLELRMTWMRTAVDPEYVKFLYQSSTRATTNPGFHACAPLLRRLYIVVTNWDPDTNKDALLQAVEAGNLEDVQLILADGVVCNSKNWGLLLVVESALKKGETDIARTVLSAMVAGSSAWIVLEDCMVGFFCTSDDRDEGRDQGKIDRFLRRFAQSYGFDIKIEVLESYEGIARQVVCLLVKDELMGAVVCGDVKELDRLLKPDVNVNARNGGGKSILHIAVECVFLGRHRELLGRSLSSARDVVMFSTAVLDRLLLVPNIDVNARDCNGSTPLHVALQLWDVRDDKEYPRCLDVVCRLLRKPSIDVNVRDEEGKTPLHCAAKWGYVEAVKKVLEAPDIDVSIRDNSGENALHVIEGEAECVSLLLATPGIDVNAQNDRERTPLVRKLSSRYELDQRVALELLKAPGLDIYAKDIKGKTALDYAVENGCLEVLRVLLDRYGPESIERAQGLYERAQGLYNWRKKEIEREGTPTEEDMRAVYDRLSEEGNVHIEYNEWREQYRKDYAERQRLRYEECEKLRAEAARLLGDFLTKHGAAPAG